MALTNRTRSVPRYGTAAGTGALAALILVGVCGSPAYVGWAGSTDANSAAGWFLRLLAWPAWSFDTAEPVGRRHQPPGRAAGGPRGGLPLAAARLAGGPRTGSASQFFTGWAAYVLASGFASLFAAFAAPEPSLLVAIQSAGTGATYGFLAGWIIGTASLGGRA